MNRPSWLPELLYFESVGGDWNRYIALVYATFKAGFVESRPTFDRLPVAIKRMPMEQGKEATFWHLVSSGSEESERIPDLRRCERIKWPRAIIDNSSAVAVLIWTNKRKGEPRVCIYLKDEGYLVVLAQRRTYFVLWTAYLVEEEHRRRKLIKEFEDYQKKLKPPP